jgi:hyperosmotically inducible protein
MKFAHRLAGIAALAFVLAGCAPSDQKAAQTVANDALIATQVRARAAAVDPATVSLLRVESKDGNVTLSGKVATAAIRRSVESAAHEVSGVRSVVDRIVVDPSAPTGAQIAADLELGARIRGALAAQTGVNAARIHVDVHRGVVTLTGTLPSKAHRDVADETVRAIPGVKVFVDNITVAK